VLDISDYIAGLDNLTVIPGGWLNQNWVQLGYQLADSVAGFSYSFVMTSIILFVMNFIPGLSLRASAEEEEMGLDDGQLGEFAYDYVELTRHINEPVPAAELSEPSVDGAQASEKPAPAMPV
jgi:Amt family ammonium transporter